MKKYLLTLFIIFWNSIYSQNRNIVLENYIQKNYSTKDISRLPISNEDLKYYVGIYIEDEHYLTLEEKELYDLVINQFEF